MAKEIKKIISKKERIYQIKLIITNQIRELFSELKVCKDKRDLFSNTVKSQKNKRLTLEHQLKDLIEEYKQSYNNPKKKKSLSYDISDLKDELELTHSSLIDIAKKSQIHHERMVNTSKDIKKLTTIEKELFYEWVRLKKEFIKAKYGKTDI